MRRYPAIAIAGLLVLAAQGCLERKISMTTEPPGATVWVNDTEVGRTPLTTGFLFYGGYDVVARKDGYEPVSTSRDTPTPLWEYPPFDLIATALPFKITKTVKWHIDLKPSDPGAADPEALIQRANELRAQAMPKPAE